MSSASPGARQAVHPTRCTEVTAAFSGFLGRREAEALCSSPEGAQPYEHWQPPPDFGTAGGRGWRDRACRRRWGLAYGQFRHSAVASKPIL